MELATQSDLEGIQSLLAELAKWLHSKNVRQWLSPHPKESLIREIDAGEVFVWKTDGVVRATITLTSARDEYWHEASEPALYVHRLAVDRAFAGQGLGSKILSWAEDELRSREIPLLRLDCMATNEVLRKYYAERGFTFCGISHYAKWDMDFALFEKPLTSCSPLS